MELSFTIANPFWTGLTNERLVTPLVCLGDGHDGVWKLFTELGSSSTRLEILDWYHLRENLHKVGGSLKRLKQAENLLWIGEVDATLALFVDLAKKQAKNFCAYLNKHRSRIINYGYYQAEQICSIGSGSVESAIKQIGLRLKLSGASVESCQCAVHTTTSLCLPQWSTCYLMFLQKWDAPDLDLVEPRAVLGCVVEHNAMARLAQEGSASFHRFQNAALTFDS